MYISKKSEIELELEAENNSMSTIHQAIINHGGVIKWVEIVLKDNRTIDDMYALFERMEKNFVKLEEYEKALYIKNGLDELKSCNL